MACRLAYAAWPESPEFGMLLSGFRCRAGISQAALTRRSGVKQSYICRLEGGWRYQVSRHHVLALAAGLNLCPADEDALLFAAGHIPASLAALFPVDPLVADVVAALREVGMDPRATRWLRHGIAAGLADARRWSRERAVARDGSRSIRAAGEP
jgi:hypothetical protein